MRIPTPLSRVALLLALAGGLVAPDQAPPRLEGLYLGQRPPGLTPRLFAPGIVATDEEEGSSGFALGGTVFLFQRFVRGRAHTYITRLKGGAWTAPELIPFWETMAENGDFVFSSDDRTLLYQVRTGSAAGPVSQVWRAEITDDGWGERAPLPPPVNLGFESYASDAADGTLYFFSFRPGGRGQADLYACAAKPGGGYAEPVNLEALNTAAQEWDPFIAPDGSCLLFCSTKPGGFGRDDLYVSFRTADGGWGPASNLGDGINSPGSENRPSVTRDGKFLFFTSTRNGSRDVFWVEAEYLDRFRK